VSSDSILRSRLTERVELNSDWLVTAIVVCVFEKVTKSISLHQLLESSLDLIWAKQHEE
jgi:hypothetical protein